MTTFDPFAAVTTPEQARAWMSRYARWGENGEQGPELMVREVFLFGLTEPVDFNNPEGPQKAAEPDAWQCEFLRAYGDYTERRVAERSGNGVGKTATLAWCVVNHFVTEFPQVTACTAPNQTQMFDALYPEILRWFERLPEWVRTAFVVKAESIEHVVKPNDSFVTFATARPENPEALAGKHCEQGSVLLVADEAQGVHERVFLAAAGSMSGRRTKFLLAGNPVYTEGLFYDAHTLLARTGEKTPGDWKSIHVNAETCKRVTEDFKQEKIRRYGIHSNAYRVFVLGEFPAGNDDTIIPLGDVISAQVRDIAEPKDQAGVWGLDPARFGDDRSCLVKRRGRVVAETPLVWRQKDTMQLSAIVHEEWNATPLHQRPKSICVDSIGLGAGVVDRLRNLGLPVRGVNVSEMAAFSDRYANLKAELWFKAKEWFAAKDVRLPADNPVPGGIALGAELALPKFRFLPSGRLQVESKMEIKKRGFPSPDVADAFILTMADTEATYIHGTEGSFTAPIKRNSSWVV